MYQIEFVFNNGDKVRDTITGYEGIVRGRSDFLTGCKRYGVQSCQMKDNKPAEWEWFDESQLELLETAAVKLAVPAEPPKPRKEGGPAIHPSHNPSP